MTDWRYWITYSGKISADTEHEAKIAAVLDAQDDVNKSGAATSLIGVEVEAIDNAGN